MTVNKRAQFGCCVNERVSRVLLRIFYVAVQTTQEISKMDGLHGLFPRLPVENIHYIHLDLRAVESIFSAP
jgi:hypothetical protein